MTATCGQITVTRCQMARNAYRAARGYGLSRWAAIYVALRSAQPVTVRAYVDENLKVRSDG